VLNFNYFKKDAVPTSLEQAMIFLKLTIISNHYPQFKSICTLLWWIKTVWLWLRRDWVGWWRSCGNWGEDILNSDLL